MRALTGLWRWRHNPLRRTTDLVEAWGAFTAVFMLTVAVPLIGWACGRAADDGLQESVRAQEERTHPTTARVLHAAAAAPRGSAAGEAAPGDRRRAVLAEWKAADGSRRTGTLVTGSLTAAPGDTFRMWTDDSGTAVARPVDRETARARAVLAGLGAAVLTAASVEGGRRLFVWRLVQRRYAVLDRAWAKAGPDWGRTGTGS
ncbi:hypothetical protein [Streptomyces sp. NPDC059176]|uniref:Rv1733c family protein n=1 Tax=unclassified Streptomyces TaxID=2593676 RepID=UPI0036A522D1